MNRLALVASLIERDTLRYTPAGIALVSVRLRHASQQHEAGVARIVELEMTALAAGPLAAQLLVLELGATRLFTGFLAHASQRRATLIFHITGLDIGATHGIR